MGAADFWANAMQAEALATLFLTRYDRVDVIPVSRYGGNRGYDLLVRLQGEGQRETAEFAVETKGIRPRSTARSKWTPVRFDPDVAANVDLPLVLFVFDVDNETGFYHWLKEPVVTDDGQAVLVVSGETSSSTNGRRPVSIRWTDLPPLDDAALKGILDRVAEWSNARDCPSVPTRQRSA